jgi:lysophospholipase L1-like esterase
VRASRAVAAVVAGAALTAASVTAVTVLTASAGVTRPVQASTLLPVTPPVRYVALGDSYAAGTGAADDAAAPGGCARSADAYPERWAAQHAHASFVSAACDGATTAGVRSRQLQALSARTTLVSLTVGGNDAGFSHVMQTCVLQFWDSACQGAVSAADAFIARALPGRLDATLRAIRARAPAAKVVVVGYPDLYDLSQSPGCLGLGTAKRAALDRGADALDRALSAAAARNGAEYADVRGEFAGHEICDSSSWLYAVTFPFGDSYHPTTAGQELGYLPAFTAAAAAELRR